MTVVLILVSKWQKGKSHDSQSADELVRVHGVVLVTFLFGAHFFFGAHQLGEINYAFESVVASSSV